MKYRYSAIDTAQTCLQKWKYLYIDKLPSEESIDMHFGTALHGGLQASLEGDDGELTFEVLMQSALGQEMRQGRRDHAELMELGKVFISRFNRLHKKKFQPKYLEQSLSGKIGPYEFEGTADFIGDFDGVPSILDFKTSNYPYPKEKIQLNEQMPLYSELAKQCLGYEAKQLVYYVFCKADARIQVISTDTNKNFIDKRLENVVRWVNMLEPYSLNTVGPGVEAPKNMRSCIMGKDYKCGFYDKCHEGGT